MKKITAVIILLAVCLSAAVFSGCAEKAKELDVIAAEPYYMYSEYNVKIFYSGEEIKNFFADNVKYNPRSGFFEKAEEMTQDGFFDKNVLLFLTLSCVSSDTEVTAKLFGTEMTFIVNLGVCEDITAKFYFFEAPKGIAEKLTFNFVNTDGAEIGGSDDIIAGGPNGRIRYSKEFGTYEAYKEFYDVFVNYNDERYFVPDDADGKFRFEYEFLSEGVKYSDASEKGYAIDFPHQTMYVDITYKGDENYRVEGVCLAFDKTAELGEIRYQITENDGKILSKDGKKLLLSIYSDDSLIYVGRIANSANAETLESVSAQLISCFNVQN